MKKLLSAFFISSTFLLPTLANALQLNVTLGKDIVDNNDKINLAYDIFYPDGLIISGVEEGMNQDAYKLWLEAFNHENAGLIPVDSGGQTSSITFGYRNAADQDIYPDSCKRISLTGKEKVYIRFSEQGCQIN